jgi:hypothetical protein
MIDVDETLRSELRRLVPVDSRHDWDEVVQGAGLGRDIARRRWVTGAAVVAAAAVLGVATPLGAALVGSVDDFSAWLTGEPGTPASESEQQAFEDANSRSWLGFPRGTQLRHLISTKAGDTTIELLGFRSGSSALCLRLKVSGKSRWSTQECAPLAELRRSGGPARPVIVDQSVGKGDKIAWYGIDRMRSPNLQITAGIVTDDVRSVVLEDDAGRQEVDASANAFLYVAGQPEVRQRVKRIWARTDTGLISIPFVPTPFGFGGGVPTPTAPAAPAAPVVEREVTGGQVGWLERREPRGESLDKLPAGTLPGGSISGRRDNVLYGRVLTPDPDRPARVALTLNAHRPDGPAAGLCTWFVTRGGAGGGCSPYPAVFERTLTPSTLSGGGARAFVTVNGVASDDVARLEALLADGQRAEVPYKDNTFIVDLPRANLPARLIAYDAAGLVIHVSEPYRDFARPSGPARGRATSLLRVSGPDGSRGELLVGPSTGGGECVYVKHFVDRRHTGVAVSCNGPTWTGPALQLSTQFQPPRFVSGRVRSDVHKVRLRFADGSATTLTPTRGYILWAAPEERLDQATGVVGAEGLSANGQVLVRQPLKPPRSGKRSPNQARNG